MIHIMKNGGHDTYNIKQFTLDTPDDLPNLPTSGIAVGSAALVISTSDVYMLNSKGKWDLIASDAEGILPSYSAEDAGKILEVGDGGILTWAANEALPSVTSEDEGKVLKVDDQGEWVAAVDSNTQYTAGDNISIDENNEISAIDTTYSAGANVSISNENVISATDTKYTAGSNIQINNENVISATDTTYSAGSGITISEQNEISADSQLPVVTSADEGKVLAVNNQGAWAAQEQETITAKSLSGDLVSFSDGADAPFADFIVDIVATQSGSGDPSPTNVRPISGWTGAKIYNLQLPNGYHACNYVELTNIRAELSVLDSYARDDLIVGVCFKVISIGQYDSIYSSYTDESSNTTRLIAQGSGADRFYINNNSRASAPYTTPSFSAKYNFVYSQSYYNKLVYQNTDYNFTSSRGTANTNDKMYIGSPNATIQYKSFWIKTTSGNYITCLVPCINPNGVSGFYDIVNNNFVTTSDPTKANAVGNFSTPNILEFPPKATIDWMTIYGANIKPLTGELIVTHDYKRLDELTWTQYANDTTGHTFQADVPTGIKPVASNNHTANINCTCYITINFGSVSHWISKNNSLCQTAGRRLLIRDERYSDAQTFSANLGDNGFMYEYETPVTYQLTPTEIRSLLGINNVWADCGAIDLTYFVQGTQPIIDYIDNSKELPAVSSTDEGKVLTVDSTGHWVASTIPDGTNTNY